MNASVLNKSVMVDEGEAEIIGALNDSFLAAYLNTMVGKYCKTVTSEINADLDNKYSEEMVQCKKLMYAMNREKNAASTIENSKFVDGDHAILSSLSGVSDDAVSAMTPLKNELEKSLNQLPLKGFQMLSPGQLVLMGQKLKGCDELLKNYHSHFSTELAEKSALAHHLEKVLDPDLLPRKDKCDSLMEAINNSSIKVSANVAVKTATLALEENSKNLLFPKDNIRE